MLLDGQLQFLNSRTPLRALLIEGPGTQFADAILEASRRHKAEISAPFQMLLWEALLAFRNGQLAGKA